jgi:hypothetical protein
VQLVFPGSSYLPPESGEMDFPMCKVLADVPLIDDSRAEETRSTCDRPCRRRALVASQVQKGESTLHRGTPYMKWCCSDGQRAT